jgi:hypothetical protein
MRWHEIVVCCCEGKIPLTTGVLRNRQTGSVFSIGVCQDKEEVCPKPKDMNSLTIK